MEWFGGEGLSRGQKGEKEESWEERMGEKKKGDRWQADKWTDGQAQTRIREISKYLKIHSYCICRPRCRRGYASSL